MVGCKLGSWNILRGAISLKMDSLELNILDGSVNKNSSTNDFRSP